MTNTNILNTNTTVQYPKIKTRFAAMVYEICLLFGIVFFAGYFFDTLTQSKSPDYLKLYRQCWLGIVLGFYFSYSWHHGWTLPMKTWRMKIVNGHSLEKVSYIHAFLRYVIIMTIYGIALVLGTQFHWGIGVAIISINWSFGFFDKKNRPLHDILGKTVLIVQ